MPVSLLSFFAVLRVAKLRYTVFNVLGPYPVPVALSEYCRSESSYNIHRSLISAVCEGISRSPRLFIGRGLPLADSLTVIMCHSLSFWRRTITTRHRYTRLFVSPDSRLTCIYSYVVIFCSLPGVALISLVLLTLGALSCWVHRQLIFNFSVTLAHLVFPHKVSTGGSHCKVV